MRNIRMILLKIGLRMIFGRFLSSIYLFKIIIKYNKDALELQKSMLKINVAITNLFCHLLEILFTEACNMLKEELIISDVSHLTI